MKKSRRLISAFIYCLTVLVFMLDFRFPCRLQAQDGAITTYQYRHVPGDKIEEFIKRETTYWSKVARKGSRQQVHVFLGTAGKSRRL